MLLEETEQKEVPIRKKIKQKLEMLILSLLEESINNEMTIEDLATKTAVARTTIDYLKLGNLEDEETISLFSDLNLPQSYPKNITELAKEIEEIEEEDEDEEY